MPSGMFHTVLHWSVYNRLQSSLFPILSILISSLDKLENTTEYNTNVFTQSVCGPPSNRKLEFPLGYAPLCICAHVTIHTWNPESSSCDVMPYGTLEQVFHALVNFPIRPQPLMALSALFQLGWLENISSMASRFNLDFSWQVSTVLFLLFVTSLWPVLIVSPASFPFLLICFSDSLS